MFVNSICNFGSLQNLVREILFNLSREDYSSLVPYISAGQISDRMCFVLKIEMLNLYCKFSTHPFAVYRGRFKHFHSCRINIFRCVVSFEAFCSPKSSVTIYTSFNAAGDEILKRYNTIIIQ